MGFKTNEYTTGGVNSPKPSAYEDKAGVTACSMDAACTTTSSNNPNIANTDPGDHHGKGSA